MKVINELRHKSSMKALVVFTQIPRSTDLIKKMNCPDSDADFKNGDLSDLWNMKVVTDIVVFAMSWTTVGKANQKKE